MSKNEKSLLNVTDPACHDVLPVEKTKELETNLTAYIKSISQYKNLSAKREKELAKKIAANDVVAKQELIQSNLKLVVAIARKIVHVSNLPMVDLIQEGNLGLMIAVDKFNYKLGYRFATYASWWIKQSIFKAISEQSHCMRIPVYVQETLSKFKKIKSQMEQKANCEVKIQEVAKKMDISKEKIDSYLTAFSKSFSLESEMRLSNGSEVTLADILQDEKACVHSAVEYKALQNDLHSIIVKLKEREQEVIKMRFGLEDLQKRTLEEIGNLYGVTKECIRQTELRAIKKLRHFALSSPLIEGYAV